MRSRLSACLLLLLLLTPASASMILWSVPTSADVTDLSISADGSTVVAAAGLVHYITRDGMLRWKQWSADYAAISADGEYIAGATFGTAMLIDPAGKRLWTRDTGGAVSAFSYSANGAEVVTGNPTGHLYFFDNSGEYLGTNTTTERGPQFPGVVDLSTSADGYYTAAVSTEAVYFYNRTGARLWEELNSTFLNGKYVALAPNSRELAVAGNYEIFYLHSGGETLWTYRPNSEITALAFAGDSSTLAVAARDGRVHILSRDGTVKGIYQAKNWISDLALSRDGSRVLASSWDNQLYLLADNGSLLSTTTFGEPVFYCAISADGTWGAAATIGKVHYLSLAAEIPPATTVTTTVVTSTATTSVPTSPVISSSVPPTTTMGATTTTPAAGMPILEATGMVLVSLIVILWRKEKIE